MNKLQVNKVAKARGGEHILTNVSFEINEGTRVGMVGANGSGKSTLFALLKGMESPDEGDIHWKKGTRIGAIDQLPNEGEKLGEMILQEAFQEANQLEKELRELEHILSTETDDKQLMKAVERYSYVQEAYETAGGYKKDSMIRQVASGLGITGLLQKPFSNMSGGERTKLALGKVLLQQPTMLLLDEPTNHLDIDAIEWLTDYLKQVNATVLCIAHDRQFLQDVAERIIEIEDGEAHSYETNFKGYEVQKEERLLLEFKHYEEQQKKIKKMKETIKQLRIWANQANPPNDSMHRRASSMEKALQRIEVKKKPIMERTKMKLSLSVDARSGEDAVLLEGVQKTFVDQPVLKQVDMHIRYQDRVAIIGPNGSGKSTLLRILLGEVKADSGSIKLDSQVKIGYLSQHLFDGYKEQSVIDVFRETVHVDEGEARQLLARFLFYGYSVFKKMHQLSGGERVRLRLAQLLHQSVNLLILDEPTNHLDVASQEVLEQALNEFDGTVILVSHDRYLVERIVTGVYWLEDGHAFYTDGAYSRAKEKRQIRLEHREQEKQVETEKKTKTKVRRERLSTEERVDELEKELAQCKDTDKKVILEAQLELLLEQWMLEEE
ncbi:ABC-F family ATP-binding cassette domain-containing protein [Paenalkalicoccus suaedae]|uniref:ABC-F family ATP-binding cassette domain-containing protein n=1 Tax=Paenalkalicoccus suaedae TaxID=2592382 RepID=A0A859FB89_9BACI|nr:ABC-F family ATP-binding cassette domain-containing protein [Paenalkalicoccus suaedae]QKS70062.1 ABC-F family ATP-binding cassette domain-containing protein [Paenalkalicoccus suaedae]